VFAAFLLVADDKAGGLFLKGPRWREAAWPHHYLRQKMSNASGNDPG